MNMAEQAAEFYEQQRREVAAHVAAELERCVEILRANFPQPDGDEIAALPGEMTKILADAISNLSDHIIVLCDDDLLACQPAPAVKVNPDEWDDNMKAIANKGAVDAAYWQGHADGAGDILKEQARQHAPDDVVGEKAIKEHERTETNE